MTERFPDFVNPVIDSSGNTISGAKLNFYITGTSTRKDTYSDSAKTTPNTNPVIAVSGGRFGEIFMDTDIAYKVVLTDAADVELWSKDPITPVLPPGTFPILNVITKSSNFTVLLTERGATFLVDASSGPVTATLPVVATAASGFAVRFKKTDSSANLVTIDGDSAETIDSLTTVALGLQNDALTITGDGTQWNIEAEKRLPTPTVSAADEIVTVNPGGTGYTTTTVPLPAGHLNGLTLSKNATDSTNDIDIAAGKARDAADTANLIATSAVGKQLDVSWSAGGTPGAPTGGLSSSLTLTNDTTYHAILGLVSGTAEVGFDTSSTGANLVTDHSFTNPTRIGAVRRGTADNVSITQVLSGGRERFTSGEQTITAGGGLTLAHGLSATPTLIQTRIVCTTAAQGYAIGDEVVIYANAGTNANEGIATWPDATNINVRFGSNASVFSIANKTTGAQALITPASWDLVVRAWV